MGKAPETSVGPGPVRSYYFELDADMRVGRHKVVFEYDPDDWPYPPEPDCQKDWDE